MTNPRTRLRALSPTSNAELMITPLAVNARSVRPFVSMARAGASATKSSSGIGRNARHPLALTRLRQPAGTRNRLAREHAVRGVLNQVPDREPLGRWHREVGVASDLVEACRPHHPPPGLPIGQPEHHA